jgi:hypothetical protein
MTARDGHMTLGIAQIVRELNALRREKVSGTYIVVCDTGHEARVAIDEGVAGAVRFNGQTHARLLEALGGIRASATRFVKIVGLGDPGPQGRLDDSYRVNTDICRVIYKHLAGILGPIADLVCDEKRALEPNQTVENLLSLISLEIDDPDRAHEFRAAVRRDLLA